MATRKKAAKKAGNPFAGFNPFGDLYGGGSGKASKPSKPSKADLQMAALFTGAGPDYVPVRTKKGVPKKVVEYRALRAKNNPRVAAIYRRVLGV